MKYGDLFSGIGCVAQALKDLKMPFTYEFACDIDYHCKNNLLHNFDVKQFYNDVKDITTLPKVDLFTAGFPCQPFSTVNKSNNKRGKDHPKYDLFTETIRCLKLCDPDVWILENVVGLTYKNNHEYFQYIKTTFDGLSDWNWDYRIMNSKDYGTPQNRKRIYFIGRKVGIPEFPKKSPILKPLHEIIDTSLPMVLYSSKAKTQKWKELEDDILYIDNGQGSGQFWTFQKLGKNDHGFGLIASHPMGLCMKRGDQLFRRNFTIDETRQIQNIHPDFENVCSESQFYKQIGNGMDVAMMAKLIKLNPIQR